MVPSPTPEERARQKIDALLEAAGWVIQDRSTFNRYTQPGVALREDAVSTGEADYGLWVEGEQVGFIEAKPEGWPLVGVEVQSAKYREGARNPDNIHFLYESTGIETRFVDLRDPDPRHRPVYAFHRPETLAEWHEQPQSLRMRLTDLPSLNDVGLWDCQVDAIVGLEQSLSKNRPRALIQMTMGSGKTYTAVTAALRLLKYGGAERILFLVDRNNLGKQAMTEFGTYAVPGDGRKFTEVYPVQRLTGSRIDNSSTVVISTIQRLYSLLTGDDSFEEDNEERSVFEDEALVNAIAEHPVAYEPRIPIEAFDFIVVDECHRSIYNEWRRVLEYFDAFVIGLTATPALHTVAYFNRNLVCEYTHEKAVIDRVNVPYWVYRIRTRKGEQGEVLEAGTYVERRDRLTREQRLELLEEQEEYAAAQLGDDVVAPDQIRTVLTVFRDSIEDMFGRTEVPKTLVFAKNDSHADDIVQMTREVFDRGDEFCQKITYRTTGVSTDDLITEFRNSYHPRIAVTVDMIATGTDIKPIECVIFMRNVNSAVYFEQMKGRGVRVADLQEMRQVSQQPHEKTNFVLIDAVGVTESKKHVATVSLERHPYVSFDRLVDDVAMGKLDEDTLVTLATRIARLAGEVSPELSAELLEAAGGRDLLNIVSAMMAATDYDRQVNAARERHGLESPTEDQVRRAAQDLANDATMPFNSPQFRQLLKDARRRAEQLVDLTLDEPISYGPDEESLRRAQEAVTRFEEFVAKHSDEIDALQVIFSGPVGDRRLTLKQLKALAQSIETLPPRGLLPQELWEAYQRLDASKVRGRRTEVALADLISLVRKAMRKTDVLEPFADHVHLRFDSWLCEQQMLGRSFTPSQLAWLMRIRDHVAASLDVTMDDFEDVPFNQFGGLIAASKEFGEDFEPLLGELSEVLTS